MFIWQQYGSQWDGSFEHSKQMLKLMGKKIFTILRSKNCVYLKTVWILNNVDSSEVSWSVSTLFTNAITYKVLAKERRGYALVLFDSNLIGCQGTTIIMYIVKYYIEMTKAVKHEHVIMYLDGKIVHLFICFRFWYGLK